MFTIINEVRSHIALTQKLRREHKLIDEATERVQYEQRIRNQVMRELSIAGMLKDHVS